MVWARSFSCWMENMIWSLWGIKSAETLVCCLNTFSETLLSLVTFFNVTLHISSQHCPWWCFYALVIYLYIYVLLFYIAKQQIGYFPFTDAYSEVHAQYSFIINAKCCEWVKRHTDALRFSKLIVFYFCLKRFLWPYYRKGFKSECSEKNKIHKQYCKYLREYINSLTQWFPNFNAVSFLGFQGGKANPTAGQ